MSLKELVFLAVGVSLILMGLIGGRTINEAEFPATAKERRNASPASRMERLLLVGLGVASGVYGLYLTFAR